MQTCHRLLSVGHAYFHSWRKLVVSLADYGFARGESSFHHNLVAKFRPKLYKAAFGRRVAPHDEDISSTFLNDECLLWHNSCVFANIEQCVYFSKLSRKQHMIGVGHLCTYRECSGLRTYLRFGKVNKSLVWIFAVVGQRYCYIRLP